MKNKFWYIKERYNPQFDKPYYVALGNISVTSAKDAALSMYGSNTILKFDSKESYENKCKELKIEVVNG